jgi:hypothetical protein
MAFPDRATFADAVQELASRALRESSDRDPPDVVTARCALHVQLLAYARLVRNGHIDPITVTMLLTRDACGGPPLRIGHPAPPKDPTHTGGTP